VSCGLTLRRGRGGVHRRQQRQLGQSGRREIGPSFMGSRRVNPAGANPQGVIGSMRVSISGACLRRSLVLGAYSCRHDAGYRVAASHKTCVNAPLGNKRLTTAPCKMLYELFAAMGAGSEAYACEVVLLAGWT
jgi:hypothetical protein